MESRKRNDSPEEVSRRLAQLAEIHAQLARLQAERKRLVAEVQGRRGHARHSIMQVEKNERRLVARRSNAGTDGDTDEAKLAALAAALETEKASHVRQVAEYGAALQAEASARSRLRRDAQALEKRRSEEAQALPRIYARAYGELVAQGVLDPIVAVSGGACVCGFAIGPQEELPTSCESCDRLLIAGDPVRAESEPAR